MTRIVVDPMDDSTRWSAVAVDGVTPSTELILTNELVVVGSGEDGVSGHLTASASAAGHSIHRTVAPLDVSECTELRLSLRADRLAGSRSGTFFLELRVGSAGLPLGNPLNTWHRLVPVSVLNRWETIRFDITDLPGAVAGTLSELRWRCVSGPFEVYIDDVVALRPRLLGDADRALVAALGGIVVDGTGVTVAVRAPAEPTPAAPALDIVHIMTRPAPSRSVEQRLTRDYTADSFRQAEVGPAYDIDYAVRPVAPTRAVQAQLLEAALSRLPVRTELVSDGDRMSVDLVVPSLAEWMAGELPVLVYRVGVRAPADISSPVTGINDVVISTDQLLDAR